MGQVARDWGGRAEPEKRRHNSQVRTGEGATRGAGGRNSAHAGAAGCLDAHRFVQMSRRQGGKTRRPECRSCGMPAWGLYFEDVPMHVSLIFFFS